MGNMEVKITKLEKENEIFTKENPMQWIWKLEVSLAATKFLLVNW